MIIGIGTDVCSIERFSAMEDRRPGAAARVLTPGERSLPPASRAARFAAKEALAKALGAPGGLSWQDVEVVRDDAGAPRFEVVGTVRARMEELDVNTVHLSISHDGGVALAMVVCER